MLETSSLDTGSPGYSFTYIEYPFYIGQHVLYQDDPCTVVGYAGMYDNTHVYIKTITKQYLGVRCSDLTTVRPTPNLRPGHRLLDGKSQRYGTVQADRKTKAGPGFAWVLFDGQAHAQHMYVTRLIKCPILPW